MKHVNTPVHKKPLEPPKPVTLIPVAKPIVNIVGSSQWASTAKKNTPEPPVQSDIPTKVPEILLKQDIVEPDSSHIEEMEPLCPFGTKGSCKYGKKCNYIHGLECPSCHQFILHPSYPNQHAEHISQCESRLCAINKKNRDCQQDSLMECVICMERVIEKKDARFGLLECIHCCCLECIRNWRQLENFQVISTCQLMTLDC